MTNPHERPDPYPIEEYPEEGEFEVIIPGDTNNFGPMFKTREEAEAFARTPIIQWERALAERIAELETRLEDALALLAIAREPRPPGGMSGQTVGLYWRDRWSDNRHVALEAAGITTPEQFRDLIERAKEREELSQIEQGEGGDRG